MRTARVLAMAALCLGAAPALAEDRFGTDFDALFRDHAGQVERRTEADGSVSEVLKLEGGTVVTRHAGGQVSTVATDGMAVGCIMHFLIAAASLDAVCPSLLTTEEKGRLTVSRERLLRYYAANVYPPLTYDDIDREFESRLKTYPWPKDLSCETGFARKENVAEYVRQFVNAPSAGFDKLLSTPRLPADNPCL